MEKITEAASDEAVGIFCGREMVESKTKEAMVKIKKKSKRD
jgi:hypothetical protein